MIFYSIPIGGNTKLGNKSVNSLEGSKNKFQNLIFHFSYRYLV